MESDGQFIIILNRLEFMIKIINLPDIEERIKLLENYTHDIQDCLYWIKKEREGIYE